VPRFETQTDWSVAADRIFAVLLRPANLPLLAPAEVSLRVVTAPEVLTLGARVTVQTRRWGIAIRLTTEVTGLSVDRLLVEEQRQGPFRRWIVTRTLEPLPGGATRLIEVVDFDPPGGLLGLRATVARVEADLAEMFAYRDRKLADWLGATETGDLVPV
jgi:ligand-binding SRPBCC domain-containing protein